MTLSRQLSTLLLLFALGPLILSNLWGYRRSREFWTEAVLRDVNHVAGMAANDARRSVLEMTEALYAAGETLVVGTEGPTGDAIASAVAVAGQYAPNVLDLWAVGQDGRLLASSFPDTARHYDPSEDPCVAGFFDPPGPVGIEADTLDPFVIVTVPLPPTRSGDGVRLCGRFSFDLHCGLLSLQRELAPFGVLYLTSADGWITWDSSDEFNPTNSSRDLAERRPTATGGRWMDQYTLPSGTDALAAFASITRPGWGVLVEVPIPAALAGLEELKWQAVGLGAILALILIIASALTAESVASHLRQVATAANRIACGAFGEIVTASGSAEIRELATVFNRMSLALRDSYGRLEERIVERTAALQRSEKLTSLLLDAIEQRVVVVERNGAIVKANRAALAAYGQEIVGRRYVDVFEKGTELPATHPIRQAFDRCAPRVDERSHRAGRPEILQVETYPVLRHGTTVESVVEIARVITAEKQIQAEHVHHERMAAFGLLAAGVAHEIGNPLAAIQSQLRLASSSDDPQRTRQTLEIVDKEVARITRLLRELVDFSRRRRDEVALISINDVVADVARLLHHDPRARGVRIDQAPRAELPGVRVKEDRVVQVLLNLGINALDAMPDGGVLTFETAVDSGDVLVRIRDNGSGIAAELQERVFEPFFSTKGPEQGTGLGLFVSRKIVHDELGGRLDLERSDRQGTTFTVRLPVAPGHADAQEMRS